MSERRSIDVSHMPTVAFRTRTTLWLGFIGVIIVEGMMILLIIVGYFYLRARTGEWPPGVPPPPLAAGLVNTGVAVFSIAPAVWLKRAAAEPDLARVRVWLAVLSGVAAATLALTGWAFATLNARWDSNAYASLVWMLLGTYTIALIAAALVLWVLAVYSAIRSVDGPRFMNIHESADYWLLAVVLWLATWGVIYVAPRVL